MPHASAPPPPRPCSKRILQASSGQLGVPQAGTRPPTVPEPFALKTDLRAVEHAGNGGGGAYGWATHASAAAGSSEQQPQQPQVFVFQAQGEGGRATRSTRAAAAQSSKAQQQQQHTASMTTQPVPFRLATDARG